MANAQLRLTGRWFDTASDDREIEVGPGMATPKKNQLLTLLALDGPGGTGDTTRHVVRSA